MPTGHCHQRHASEPRSGAWRGGCPDAPLGEPGQPKMGRRTRPRRAGALGVGEMQPRAECKLKRQPAFRLEIEFGCRRGRGPCAPPGNKRCGKVGQGKEVRPRPRECEGGQWQKSGRVVGEENSGKLRGPPGGGERKEAWGGRGVSALKGRKAGVAWARGKQQREGLTDQEAEGPGNPERAGGALHCSPAMRVEGGG